MGKGKAITAEERGQIKAYLSDGLNFHEIAEKIGRSFTLVRNCAVRGTDKDPGKSKGRKRKLSERDERNIARHASNQQVSANRIREYLNLGVSKSTVLRSLDHVEHLQYKNYRLKPKLSHENVEARLAFATSHVAWENRWNSVIYSDEKAFNLDGPEGWSSYWHDLRKEDITMSKRKFQGGSVKIWIGFSYAQKASIGTYTGPFTSKKYIKLLSKHFIPLYHNLSENCDNDVLFQQDNDSRHKSEATMEWLDEHGVSLLDWPANSPDLAPAENIFGILARAVYAEKSSYNTKGELEDAIRACWDDMDQGLIQHTIDSLHQRMIDVIAVGGHSTSH